MPQTTVQGAAALFEISVDGETFETLVCEIDVSLEGTVDVTEEKTKCGNFKGVEDPSYSLSGNAVTNISPDSGEASYKTVQAFFNGKTKLYWRLQSPAIGSFLVGEGFYHAGQGYFTNLSLSASNGELIKFSYTFTVDGNIDIEPVSAPSSFDTTLSFVSDTEASGGGIGAVSGATDAQQQFKFNLIASPVGTPLDMTITVGGEEEVVITYPSDYANTFFEYIDNAGVSHSGVGVKFLSATGTKAF